MEQAQDHSILDHCCTKFPFFVLKSESTIQAKSYAASCKTSEDLHFSKTQFDK